MVGAAVVKVYEELVVLTPIFPPMLIYTCIPRPYMHYTLIQLPSTPVCVEMGQQFGKARNMGFQLSGQRHDHQVLQVVNDAGKGKVFVIVICRVTPLWD